MTNGLNYSPRTVEDVFRKINIGAKVSLRFNTSGKLGKSGNYCPRVGIFKVIGFRVSDKRCQCYLLVAPTMADLDGQWPEKLSVGGGTIVLWYRNK